MEKHEMFAQIDGLEEQIGKAYAELGDLKKTIISLLEDNQRLMMENQQLRKLLKQGDAEETDSEPVKGVEPVIGEGYDNLARLYYEGFHICNVYYGHLRTEGDCLFCLSFLNK
ncbi:MULTISPECIES: DNA replication initiation control protein YabA [unclassified Paenibacillus]|uniref:DNA replication initiation control protein YabA n=1 Tax=Paenibacillus TaxID=44249 RepID=UPI00020D7CF7|nr:MULTISPECIES: DNA replication initiation control protein YabA [unclassified Paenibacillus]EGL19696.1 hypothetical protein HMPREF9413_6076 [Paenibacillus sp. HGF7]MBV6717477.1 DNA replication initiation control protein YabA [Paenibacillus chitinolyticus]